MPTKNLLRLLLLPMLMMRVMLARVCCRFGSWGLVIKLNLCSDLQHFGKYSFTFTCSCMVASAVHLTEAISESENQLLRFDFMMFFTFSISTIMILFCSKMDQLQLHLRLFKVLSSLSVTPNLSDYAWQLNYVILLCMLNIIISYLLQHTVWPNPYTWCDLIVSVEFDFTKNIS